MLREYLVGVVFDMGKDSDFHSQEIVLVDFLGEGAETVVYAYASLDNFNKRDSVVKFPKPVVWLEMESLHYSLRVDEEHYPDHPLLMSDEARLDMLSREMLSKIKNGHLVYRVGIYRDVLNATIEVLGRAFAEPFNRGEPFGPLLDESVARPWIDDNLLQLIDDQLAEDAITEEYRPMLEALREVADAAITRWRATGSYRPMSRNALVNLLGLYAEHFIAWHELDHIRRLPGFVELLSPHDYDGLFNLISTLHFRLMDRLGGSNPKDVDQATRSVGVAVRACDLLADVGDTSLRGRARLWQAYLLLLIETPAADVQVAAESALEELDQLQGLEGLADLHDTLLLLADLCQSTEPERSQEYRIRAQEILDRLGLAESPITTVPPPAAASSTGSPAANDASGKEEVWSYVGNGGQSNLSEWEWAQNGVLKLSNMSLPVTAIVGPQDRVDIGELITVLRHNVRNGRLCLLMCPVTDFRVDHDLGFQALVDTIGECEGVQLADQPRVPDGRHGFLLGSSETIRHACSYAATPPPPSAILRSFRARTDFSEFSHLWKNRSAGVRELVDRFSRGPESARKEEFSHLFKFHAVAEFFAKATTVPMILTDAHLDNFGIDDSTGTPKLIDFNIMRWMYRNPSVEENATGLVPLMAECGALEWEVFRRNYIAAGGDLAIRTLAFIERA